MKKTLRGDLAILGGTTLGASFEDRLLGQNSTSRRNDNRRIVAFVFSIMELDRNNVLSVDR